MREKWYFDLSIVHQCLKSQVPFHSQQFPLLFKARRTSLFWSNAGQTITLKDKCDHNNHNVWIWWTEPAYRRGCLARFRSEWFTQTLDSVSSECSHDPRYDLIPSYEWQWVFMTFWPQTPLTLLSPPSPPTLTSPGDHSWHTWRKKETIPSVSVWISMNL